MDKEKKLSKIDELKYASQVTQTLYDIANSINTSTDLNSLYEAIHDSLKRVMDVTNFFIAIVDREKKTLFFPYHVDTEDDDFGAITDFDTNDSLTGIVVQKAESVFLKEDEIKKRADNNGVWGPIPVVWLGVPLKIKNEVIGVVAIQSYTDPGCYTKKDIELLASVSDQIAVAIDRKRYEERLEKSENKFIKLFQTLPCWCMLAKVKTGEVIEANHTFFETSGYSRQEVIGKTGVEFGLYVNPEDRQKALEEFFDTGKLYDFPIQFRLKNGLIRDFLWSAQTFSMDGQLCWISAILDITEKRLADEERHRANRLAAEQEKHALVGRVAGKMAHDFNNILGAIMGNAELALLDCEDGEMKKTLDLILGQTIRGRSLTKNLTAFAKNQEPKHESFSVNDTFDLVISLLKRDLSQIKLVKKYEQDIPDLIADPGMIEHAVVNLIQNAIHALSKTKDPKIMIKTFSEGNHICFEIKDNGCGIPKCHMADIFEPSFTLKGGNDRTGSYSTEIKGTGYGVSNVMRYIDQHKGGVYVESQVDHGTTFIVRLPLIREKLTDIERKELTFLPLKTGKKILLVEDESAISNIQYQILTQAPCKHNVDIARDGQEAMDLFLSHTYDLVSLDYQLPGKITGLDVYNEMVKTNKIIPVLFVSGNIEFLESINQLKQHRHIDYLSKPCSNALYLRAINQLLSIKNKPTK